MERATRKVRVGIVVSDSREKTVTVEVRDAKRHPRYGKTVPVRKKYHAHDEANDANVGGQLFIEFGVINQAFGRSDVVAIRITGSVGCSHPGNIEPAS